jgi:hypothetical protein
MPPVPQGMNDGFGGAVDRVRTDQLRDRRYLGDQAPR